MSSVRSALVVGGGIAGPVTALALRKVGIDATVYEAYPPGSNGIGGGLALEPNGLATLDLVGAGDAVRAVSTPISRSIMSLGGKPLADMPSLTGLEPRRVLQRDDLHRALHHAAAAAGMPIEHGRRLIGATEHAGGVTATFHDGGTATADVLIGADGIRSAVRRLIDPDAPGPNYTGMIGFGGLVEADLDVEPGTMVFAFGRRAYYLYWREPDGRIAWGANLPWTQSRSGTSRTLSQAREIPAQQWVDRLRETYAGDQPGELLARLTTAETLVNVGPLHIMPPVPHWHRGRMVLVGDAVHAPSNSTGQGASLAAESAIELARCLRDLPDHGSAFTAYEALRRLRVEKIAARGAKINHAKTPGPMAKVFMRAVMPLFFRPSLIEKTMGAEQRFRIDWTAPVE
jgi:2-polyprenyl-6-methoxyphenol hydroxylase-like FAD-dependent oxidoreductase